MIDPDARKARNARYQAKRRLRGMARPGRFDTGRFVAVDGEGFSDGAEVSVTVGNPAHDYIARDHFYALLMDSDGNELWAPSGRLATKQCLDFLLDIAIRDPLAVPVILGGSYDVCHMLAFGIGADDVRDMLRGAALSTRRYVDVSLSHDGATHDYRLEYRPRKQFTIWRFEHGADKYREHVRRDGRVEWKLNAEARVTLWDVWGFFQGTFIGAMRNWIPDDPDWLFIEKMKGERNIFDRAEIDTIRRYTSAELRCLATMMERVRDSIRSLGLAVKRWDGAGAIAGAMFAKNNVREQMGATPQEVFDAARIAYSGGHIEATAIGHHEGKVWHYDINSAYPHQFRRLPGLDRGRWITQDGVVPQCETIPAGFTLVRLEYHFLPGLPFYPLFHRAESGAILYPERGSGWFWFDEFDAAREFSQKFGAFTFRVTGWHHFETDANASPFGWIEDAYQVRRDVIMRSRETGVRDDSHMMIRLGLNSCYGKTAQQVGARYEAGEIVPPTYFQLEWAGAVTAGCRAQLMRAAMQKPEAIVSFATDAIFSTSPLELPHDAAKRLGEWEAHEHLGMTIVMPGVYWLHEAGNRITHFSRGFDKAEMRDCQFVMDAWKRGQSSITVKQRRMITLGAAMMSENLWAMRGLFVDTTREMAINGLNSKRYPAAMTQVRPHKELCRLRVRDHAEDVGQDLSSLMSAPYPIAWLDGTDETADAFADGESAFLADNDAYDSAFLA